MGTMRIDHNALRSFIREIFVAAGFRKEEAAVEADVLVWADLRGLASHGVFRLPMYLAWKERGLRNAESKPEVVKARGAACLIDADRAPGLYTMTRAMERAIDLAREHAVGWVVVRRTTHTGPMGYYVRQAADAGMIGIATCASMPLMAYHGTRVPALGTSPLGIAVPRKDGAPAALDMASAAIAWGKLAQSRVTNQPLPPGVALDAEGRETTDPHAADVPLPLAGPKGSGLAFMIECLTSLAGGFPLAAPDPESGENTNNVQNALVIAADPDAFGDAETMAADVDRLCHTLAALPKDATTDDVLMPGERGDREAARRRTEGIEIPDDLWGRLTSIAADLGVTPPEAHPA